MFVFKKVNRVYLAFLLSLLSFQASAVSILEFAGPTFRAQIYEQTSNASDEHTVLMVKVINHNGNFTSEGNLIGPENLMGPNGEQLGTISELLLKGVGTATTFVFGTKADSGKSVTFQFKNQNPDSTYINYRHFKSGVTLPDSSEELLTKLNAQEHSSICDKTLNY